MISLIQKCYNKKIIRRAVSVSQILKNVELYRGFRTAVSVFRILDFQKMQSCILDPCVHIHICASQFRWCGRFLGSFQSTVALTLMNVLDNRKRLAPIILFVGPEKQHYQTFCYFLVWIMTITNILLFFCQMVICGFRFLWRAMLHPVTGDLIVLNFLL